MTSVSMCFPSSVEAASKRSFQTLPRSNIFYICSVVPLSFFYLLLSFFPISVSILSSFSSSVSKAHLDFSPSFSLIHFYSMLENKQLAVAVARKIQRITLFCSYARVFLKSPRRPFPFQEESLKNFPNMLLYMNVQYAISYTHT